MDVVNQLCPGDVPFGREIEVLEPMYGFATKNATVLIVQLYMMQLYHHLNYYMI